MKLLDAFFHKPASTTVPAGEDLERINNYYVTGLPSPQQALDIFKGEWSSRLPPPFDQLQAGALDLFQDARIQWLVSEVGDLRGQQVLELGPLEGGHSYLLEHSGAAAITAIEDNTHAYLKCLIVKELLGLRRVRFLCGDFVAYLKEPDCPPFDIGVASGVLYHMLNPVELIALLARCCQRHLLIWTHYYDEAWANAQGLQSKFPSQQLADYAGFSHTLVRQHYGPVGLGWAGFCGGSRPYSHWMVRDDILGCLRYFGFTQIAINFDEYKHPNGPAFALLASRG